jgi:hypothetical protein
MALSSLLGVDPADLFQERICGRLASHSRPGQYPSAWFEKCERQLPAICRQYPHSFVRSYSFMTSNTAVTRETFRESGGFDPLLRKGEDFDLGIRIAAMGRTFVVAEDARAYCLDFSTSRKREWTRLERDMFIQRNPHRSAVAISLCEPEHATGQSDDRSFLPSGPLDIADGERDSSCRDWLALLSQVPPAAITGRFDYSQREIAAYFSEAAGVDEKTMSDLICGAVADGLIVRQSPSGTYFDIHHTGNWLRTRTEYQEHWLKNASFARTHLTPRQYGESEAPPTAVHYQGRYTMELNPAAGRRWDEVIANMSVPVEHDCQTKVKLTRFFPPELESYFNKESGLIADIPGSLLGRAGSIAYEFECDTVESIFPEPEQRAGDVDEEKSSIKARHLLFTFPDAYLEKATVLLDYILGGRRADPEAEARQI